MILCKVTIPHLLHVDNVDNFVYNSILQAFQSFKKVENYCTSFSTIEYFRYSLCNLLNFLFFRHNTTAFTFFNQDRFRLQPAADNHNRKS